MNALKSNNYLPSQPKSETKRRKPHQRKLEGVEYILTRVEKFKHIYYLECVETGQYLAQTKRSDFLLRYDHRTHMSVYPVGFTTLEDATAHAQAQTHPKRKHLQPRKFCDFFSQFITGHRFEEVS